jgi:hypothetical protein
MNRLLRWVTPVFLCCVALAVIVFGVNVSDLVGRWRTIVAEQQPPIVIHNQRIVWTGPRTFDSNSDGSTWTRTCPLVVISRGVLLKDGTFVGLPARVISGPLKGTQRNPRFEIRDITPQERQPNVIRFDLPDWLDASDLTLYQVTMRVPNDTPCADGYTGTSTYLLTIPDAPYASR